MQETIVLYPAPGIGHLVPMVELGKLILRHQHHIFITVLLTTGPFDSPTTTAYINQTSKTIPSLIFQPFPSLPAEPSATASSPIDSLLHFITNNNQNLHQALKSISETSTIRALIIDFFTTAALQVSSTLSIPTYYFFTSGAAGLAAFLYIPTIHNETTQSLKELTNTHLHFPGLPPIRASHMSEALLDRDSHSYHEFLHIAESLPKSRGILVNTFESLEPRAIKAIANGLCVPSSPIPPVYYIGPLIANPENRTPECLAWLDSQPSRSVVFLCFGSQGIFSVEQLKEIATGLEQSGHRFLWVVRNPQQKPFAAATETDLDALLPEGFLDRTRERGLVVKSWAPQVEVLSRESVGGFVTHCGWNSILEAVCAGVPMVAWPLYAEQRMNRTVLVEDMKLAMAMEQREKDGFVSGTEVEKRVRALLESDDGRAIRERSLKMRDGALAAWAKDGSSRAAFGNFAQSWEP
ncbi:UDP-glycosyltransferase 88F4-like [Macadamia integrifolia]|uniref:UDP-glycosyltransferase 88F4-like n=1 Tax=Macadamia integrifolia TaxID=60698 RepID=UPI001C4FC048|nr:UDP-glycosyltransferase 88F4-like [Macadamia integrifolia]